MIKLINNKSISSYGIVFICICIFMMVLFTGCDGATGGDLENKTIQTQENTSESVSETVEDIEETESAIFELGKIYMDDALKAELEKTDKASYYMILVTENTGIDDETVNRKFVESVGLGVIYNSYLRNHIIHVSAEGLRKLRCPENMSISLQLAFPVEYYDKNLREVEEWKYTLLVDELYVKVVLEGTPGTYVDYDTQKEKNENFMKDYNIGEEEKINFSYNHSDTIRRQLYLVLSKDKIEKMLNDDRVQSITPVRAEIAQEF